MSTSGLMRSAMSLAIGLALSTQVAHAGDVISSASLSIENLRFRLIDLAPDDGIAPSITFQGIWTGKNRSYDVVDESMVGPSANIPMVEGTFFETSQGYVFGAGVDGADGTAAGNVAYAGVAGNRVNVASALQPDRFTTAVRDDSSQFSFRSTDEQGNEVEVTVTNTTLNLLGAGRSETTLGVHGTGTPYVEAYEPGYGPSTFTLSANTMLIVEGTVLSDLAVDRSSMLAAQGLLPVVDDALGYNSINAFGGASTSLEISVTDSMYYSVTDAAITNHGSWFTTSHALFYNDLGIMLPAPNAPDGSEVIYDEAITADKSYSDSLQLIYANIGADARDVVFYVRAQAVTDQTIWGSHYSSLSTTAPVPVPEPGSYALMGLGLVGLLLARRRNELI